MKTVKVKGLRFKIWSIALLSLGFIFLVLPVSGDLFVFKDNSGAEFVFKLTNPVKIKQANAILEKKETAAVHVMGRIIKSKAVYNSKWHFHLDPGTIQFFESSIEVCDASIEYVEDNLDEVCGAFLPGCYWCPWSSKVIKKVKSKTKSTD